MRRDFTQKMLGLLAGMVCLFMFSGCDSVTSQVIEPVDGSVFETDAVTGYAEVPFEAVFVPHAGDAVVDMDSIEVKLGEAGSLWGFLGDDIFDMGDGTNEFGFTINGPDETGAYTVSGTMDLLPGSYWVKSKCTSEGVLGSYFTDGSDRSTFIVNSGFEIENFEGGVQGFYHHSTDGICFWLSALIPVGESLIAGIMAPSGIDVPGWDDLPVDDLLFIEAFPPFPEVTADFAEVAGEITVSVSPTSYDIEIEDPAEWMEIPITFNGETWWICGFQFELGPGALLPVMPDLTDMELTFYNMAFYVAEDQESECEVARAATIFQMTSPLDAKETCECTAFYRGWNP
jgi:hypothetical protein